MAPKSEVLEERMNNLIETNKKEHNEILAQIACINKKLDEAFVTKTEFEPYKWGIKIIAGAFLTAVVYAVIKLISSHGVL